MEQGINANGTFVNVRYLLYEEPLPEIWEPAPLPKIWEPAHEETTLPKIWDTYQILNKDSTKVNRSAIDEAAAPLPLKDELAVLRNIPEFGGCRRL
jgi:hypothetical protein